MHLDNNMVSAGSGGALGIPGRRFAIIGAGSAGLCAAKYLISAGLHDVTIFEAGSKIGGLWCYENDNGESSAYATLHINTPKSITSFSDMPFAEHVQVFPDHRDMYEYFTDYANRFDLIRHIRFNSRVKEVRPVIPFDPRTPKWRVTTERGQTEVFDRVLVCTGHLAVPRHVKQLVDDFGGEYLHTHDYRSPDKFVGKRVCIVGAGNSACDVASDICMTSPKTFLVARSGVVIVPKLIFGKPYHDIKHLLERRWIPQWLRARIERLIVYAVQGDMTELGFKLPKKRVHGTSNAFLVQHIRYRRVTVKPGIERIDGRRIHFSDGTSEEFDVLIAGTGYHVAFPFVSETILPVKDNSVDLYKRMVVPDWPGMYFIGLTNQNTSAMLVFEKQMQWILPHEKGLAMLPSAPEMRADIEARKASLRVTFQDSPRHALEEPYQQYFPALEQSLKEALRRMERAERGTADKPSPFENVAATRLA